MRSSAVGEEGVPGGESVKARETFFLDGVAGLLASDLMADAEPTAGEEGVELDDAIP